MSKVILTEYDLIVKMEGYKTKSGIELQGSESREKLGYGVVVVKGRKIEDLDVGDIVLMTRTNSSTGFKYEDNEYLILSRPNIQLATKPDNFNKDKADVSKIVS
ncbi:MAG: hypothetical protein GF383_15865 [Candidatus Lokiarchaeota archaeon]|nr:hypothetical protein [Candidatus Lokiarchaeota archaeon]